MEQCNNYDKKTQESQITVILVNYHKASRLVNSVRSILSQDGSFRLKIVIIDNSCNENERIILKELAMIDDVHIIFSESNIGYTKGVNIGLSYAPESSYFILCSPDIILERVDVIKRCIAIMAVNSIIGVLAPVQLNDDGSTPEVGRVFPNFLNQLKRRLFNTATDTHLTTLRNSMMLDVDWVQSSFCIVKDPLLKATVGLNEAYFLFMADVELCMSAWRLGWSVRVANIPGVRADGIRASRGGILAVFVSKTARIHVMDAWRFYFRNGWKGHERRVD